MLPKTTTLCPEAGEVAVSDNKVACFRIQSCRFWQQSFRFQDTNSPILTTKSPETATKSTVSGYRVAVFGNKRGQAIILYCSPLILDSAYTAHVAVAGLNRLYVSEVASENLAENDYVEYRPYGYFYVSNKWLNRQIESRIVPLATDFVTNISLHTELYSPRNMAVKAETNKKENKLKSNSITASCYTVSYIAVHVVHSVQYQQTAYTKYYQIEHNQTEISPLLKIS